MKEEMRDKSVPAWVKVGIMITASCVIEFVGIYSSYVYATNGFWLAFWINLVGIISAMIVANIILWKV